MEGLCCLGKQKEVAKLLLPLVKNGEKENMQVYLYT